MPYRIAADIVLVVHFAFIAFVVLGGLIALHRPRMALVHLPAAAWGVFVELSGRVCPLTAWENHFRVRAGESGYAESFVEHYVLPLVYPASLTREAQWWLAGLVLVVNVAVYACVVTRRRRRRHSSRRAG